MIPRGGFSGSYAPEDVTFLLKPITMPTVDVAEKERLIQSGARHYSEMLSPEAAPSHAYMAIYAQALTANARRLAGHINALADAILAQAEPHRTGAVPPAPVGTHPPTAIVSLARAGTPIGILLTRALRRQGLPTAHYAVSIIRDRGIDRVALDHILARHAPSRIFFVDGWTGKGAIAAELRGPRGATAAGIVPYLAVIADPAGRADLAATFDDYLIPSGILNGIVSGLVSRSVLNPQIGPSDFHGTVRLDHLAARDLSRQFVDHVDALAKATPATSDWSANRSRGQAQACDALVARIAAETRITDTNRIKPGIAEATRAVLRRVPHRLLLSDPGRPDLVHLVHLAGERGVPIHPLPPGSPYHAVAIIAAAGAE